MVILDYISYLAVQRVVLHQSLKSENALFTEMIQELPPEIFEEIIGYLWDDKPALRACSLASKILTAPSQKHIFSCIVLRGPRELFYRQLYQHVYPMGGISTNFLRLLEAYPHISGYVDCLQIIDVKPYEEVEFTSSDDDPPVHYNGPSITITTELFAKEVTPEDGHQVDTPEVGEAQGVESAEVEAEITQEVGGGEEEEEEEEETDDDDDDDDYSQNDWLSEDKSLPLILPRLHSLKALVVDFVQNWKNLSKEIRSSLLRVLQLPSLRYVELTPFPIPLLTQAVHENLKHLYLRAYCKSKGVKNVLVPGPGTSGPIYLDSLYASHTDDFLSFLESQPNCRFKTDRLRKLGLDVDGEQEGHGRISNFLRNCSDTLEEFIFTPNSDRALLILISCLFVLILTLSGLQATYHRVSRTNRHKQANFAQKIDSVSRIHR